MQGFSKSSGLARFVVVVLTLVLLPPASQAFPDRTVRVIVPFAAGGGTDALSRILAERLTHHLGQRFVIENVTGAAGNVGADRVAKSEPDGHTLLIGSMGILSVNPWIYRGSKEQILDKLEPVSLIFDTGHIVVSNPALGVTDLAGLKARAETAPKLSFASAGAGTSTHLYGELFKMSAKVDMVHVPYRGNAPALADVVAGHVHVMFDQVASAIEQAKGANVRPLAVTTNQRLPGLPDVPTAAEAGFPDLTGTSWTGLMVAKGTSQDVLHILRGALAAIAAEPETKARMNAIGAEALAGSGEELARLIERERERWGRVVLAAGIKG